MARRKKFDPARERARGEMLAAEAAQRPSGGGSEQFTKYSSSSSRNTGKPQTDIYFGDKGDKGGHIAVNDDGDIEHVRDIDGEVLYRRYDPEQPYS